MKIIDLEAHFYTQEYVNYLRSRQDVPREDHDGDVSKLWYSDKLCQTRGARLEKILLDSGEKRLKTMDAAGITMQVISLPTPGIQLFEAAEAVVWARKVNDELSKIVNQYPDRFIGLAAVAAQSPPEAADELERAVSELGFKGLILLSHARNEYLDDRKYRVIFARAEKLDVPVYLHPAIPSKDILKPYADYGFSLAGPVLGFAADTALHVMRLIYSGLFDEYPGLKIILGHLGEGLPYWLPRLDFYWQKTWAEKKPFIERKPSDYLKTNFTVTTGGIFFPPAFLCAYLALGADKVAFSVDYPYEENAEALRFLQELPVCDDDKEKIAHINAERLFKM